MYSSAGVIFVFPMAQAPSLNLYAGGLRKYAIILKRVHTIYEWIQGGVCETTDVKYKLSVSVRKNMHQKKILAFFDKDDIIIKSRMNGFSRNMCANSFICVLFVWEIGILAANRNCLLM